MLYSQQLTSQQCHWLINKRKRVNGIGWEHTNWTNKSSHFSTRKDCQDGPFVQVPGTTLAALDIPITSATYGGIDTQTLNHSILNTLPYANSLHI